LDLTRTQLNHRGTVGGSRLDNSLAATDNTRHRDNNSSGGHARVPKERIQDHAQPQQNGGSGGHKPDNNNFANFGRNNQQQQPVNNDNTADFANFKDFGKPQQQNFTNQNHGQNMQKNNNSDNQRQQQQQQHQAPSRPAQAKKQTNNLFGDS